ncbi:MAG: preprotein translocase subunit YajC [Candidatus Omnitrophica bacterium]|nr:preprotein translocase subunit YajC [Candidatus Omnitrophota bacterium]
MLTLAFAQNAPAQAPQMQQNPLMGLLPIALIFIVFYFLLIRPQKKNQQEHAKMLENLQKNDEVVTAGGLFGTVVNIQNDVVTLRVDDNTRIKVQKSSVAKLRKPKSE